MEIGINFYKAKSACLPGTSYQEILKSARRVYKQVGQKTKRRPYVRSAYFNKDKIFLSTFWQHLQQKNPRDRYRRLRYFSVALEVLLYSRNDPVTKENPNKRDELVHRFAGLTSEKEAFYVQIKENKHNGKKYLMSCFPAKNK